MVRGTDGLDSSFTPDVTFRAPCNWEFGDQAERWFAGRMQAQDKFTSAWR